MKNIEKIRLCVLCSLVFCFMGACHSGNKPVEDVYFGYEGKQVKKIHISRELLRNVDIDSMKPLVQVRLAQKDAPPILGELIITSEEVIFQPLIAFTPGMKYELFFGDKKHSVIEIPVDKSLPAPTVMSIFPGQDSLPENLLKVYIQFSQPMQEGSSAEHILLVKGEKDTLKNVFLDLQPELWNHDRTMLTLWLDPGRIKRHLQPNEKMGTPLVAGANYNLIVTPGWQSGNGLATEKMFEKKFFTTVRDSAYPDPSLWKFDPPRAGNKLPLIIELNESLDHELLLNAISIVDNNGKKIKGEVLARSDGKKWIFKPGADWISGNYTIEIESKLEDLAGNNLNRLFDTDLTKPPKSNQQEIYKLTFTIK